MTALADLTKNVKMTVHAGARKPYAKRDEWQQSANDYRITLTYQGRSMSFDYYMGPALQGEPEILDVLDCVMSDSAGIENAQGFEDWCSEYGYDSDSRNAFAIFNACKRQHNAAERVFGDDFETFLWAERA